MDAKSYSILPMSSWADYRDPAASPGQPRKPNIKKLAVGVSLALATITLLYKPAFNHYQRIYDQACSSKTHSVEERANRVLSTTPLIGKGFCAAIERQGHT